MDDIIIFSASFDEHVSHIVAVLEALTSHSLAIKPSKVVLRSTKFVSSVLLLVTKAYLPIHLMFVVSLIFLARTILPSLFQRRSHD